MASATELRVDLRLPDGVVPSIRSADLLVNGWGWTERLPVTFRTQGTSVIFTIPLDERFGKRWPKVANTNMDHLYLYVVGRNFVPFLVGNLWPHYQPGSDSWTIELPRGQAVTMRNGETRTVVFTARTVAEPHSVRFVDDADRPVPDVRVSAHVGWEALSHCLSFSADEPKPLAFGVRSDARGVVKLPDGDFPYVLAVDVHEHQEVQDAAFIDSDGALKTTFTGERVVRVRNLPRRPLSLRVFVGDRPAEGFSLVAPRGFRGCGSSGAVVFDPDEMDRATDGTVTVPDFYPDEVAGVCLADASGALLWHSNDFSKPLEVRLPPGTTFGMLSDNEFYRCSDFSGRR